MNYVVLGIGALLTAAGALSIYSGYDIIQVERGWTEVIAGTTAVSGGIITISLALILGRLQTLCSLYEASPLRLADAHKPDVEPPLTLSPFPLTASPDMAAPEPEGAPLDHDANRLAQNPRISSHDPHEFDGAEKPASHFPQPALAAASLFSRPQSAPKAKTNFFSARSSEPVKPPMAQPSPSLETTAERPEPASPSSGMDHEDQTPLFGSLEAPLPETPSPDLPMTPPAEVSLSLDHDDFEQNQFKIMNVSDSNSLEREADEKLASAFSHPALVEVSDVSGNGTDFKSLEQDIGISSGNPPELDRTEKPAKRSSFFHPALEAAQPMASTRPIDEMWKRVAAEIDKPIFPPRMEAGVLEKEKTSSTAASSGNVSLPLASPGVTAPLSGLGGPFPVVEQDAPPHASETPEAGHHRSESLRPSENLAQTHDDTHLEEALDFGNGASETRLEEPRPGAASAAFAPNDDRFSNISRPANRFGGNVLKIAGSDDSRREKIEKPPRDVRPAMVPEPSVIGRYEAEGTAYLMFSDGSIEAQSEAGIFHFASMADLKSFIENKHTAEP